MSVTFLLVHGAFRGGWQWDAVADQLRAAGHVVHAPDLPGDGPQDGRVDLTAYMDALERVVEAEGLRDVVLVGHSQGGFVARALTQRIAGRVALLALLDAPDPAHGQRAVDLGPPMPALPPADMWIDATPLQPGDELDAGTAARLTARLRPTPVAVALEPVVLDAPAALALPTAHAFCTRTPPGYPCETTRAAMAREGRPFVLLDAPHDAPLHAPSHVAGWLLDLAGTISGTAFR